MSERKSTNFIPKWARDGKWEWADDFPPVGVPDEPQAPEPTKEELQAEVDRLRGLLREFCAETRADLERIQVEHHCQTIQAVAIAVAVSVWIAGGWVLWWTRTLTTY